MITRNYTISAATLRTLEALAYWNAEEAHQREYDYTNTAELKRISDTIHALFDECREKGIASILVNQALYFGSDWRNYMNNYLVPWAKSRGVILTVK